MRVSFRYTTHFMFNINLLEKQIRYYLYFCLFAILFFSVLLVAKLPKIRSFSVLILQILTEILLMSERIDHVTEKMHIENLVLADVKTFLTFN